MAISYVDLSQNGFAIVYDEYNQQLAANYISMNFDEWDFSNSLIVTRAIETGFVMVYNELLQNIAGTYAGKRDESFHVSGQNIIFTSPNRFVTIYNQHLEMISANYR
jgi:hypothetical protein